jgi:hypothetical protein
MRQPHGASFLVLPPEPGGGRRARIHRNHSNPNCSGQTVSAKDTFQRYFSKTLWSTMLHVTSCRAPSLTVKTKTKLLVTGRAPPNEKRHNEECNNEGRNKKPLILCPSEQPIIADKIATESSVWKHPPRNCSYSRTIISWLSQPRTNTDRIEFENSPRGE